LKAANAVSGIYLDANATTRPHEAVISNFVATMRDAYANPSSGHWLGLSIGVELGPRIGVQKGPPGVLVPVVHRGRRLGRVSEAGDQIVIDVDRVLAAA
jgi:hypothetical protein